ncbi:MAG: hypothetical protein ABII22_04370 [Candidatus Micrarchaeota archaeon]
MFEELSRAFQNYRRRPISIIITNFQYIFFQLLTIFTALGVFFLMFYLFSFLRLEFNMTVIGSIGMVLFFTFMYLSCGFKGAMLRAYSDMGKKMGFMEFFGFATRNAPKFFGIGVIRLTLILVFVAPILAAYSLALKDMNLPYIEVVIGLLTVSLIFLMYFLFFGAFIYMAKTTGSIGSAIKSGFGMLRRKHILALAIYAAYAFFWMLPVIPLVLYFTVFQEIYILLLVPIFLLPNIIVLHPLLTLAQVELCEQAIKSMPVKSGNKRGYVNETSV